VSHHERQGGHRLQLEPTGPLGPGERGGAAQPARRGQRGHQHGGGGQQPASEPGQFATAGRARYDEQQYRPDLDRRPQPGREAEPPPARPSGRLPAWDGLERQQRRHRQRGRRDVEPGQRHRPERDDPHGPEPGRSPRAPGQRGRHRQVHGQDLDEEADLVADLGATDRPGQHTRPGQHERGTRRVLPAHVGVRQTVSVDHPGGPLGVEADVAQHAVLRPDLPPDDGQDDEHNPADRPGRPQPPGAPRPKPGL